MPFGILSFLSSTPTKTFFYIKVHRIKAIQKYFVNFLLFLNKNFVGSGKIANFAHDLYPL